MILLITFFMRLILNQLVLPHAIVLVQDICLRCGNHAHDMFLFSSKFEGFITLAWHTGSMLRVFEFVPSALPEYIIIIIILMKLDENIHLKHLCRRITPSH